MGYYVHLNVVFACDGNDEVAKLAQNHLEQLSQEAMNEVRWFLKDLSGRSGVNKGPKGGLSLWGIIGNYTNGEEFCETLRPFWADLLRGVPDGPLPCEHILVFYEPEQEQRATAFEIMYHKESDALEIVRHDNLPFCWGQI